MPRPRRHRIIRNKPDVVFFKPAGIPIRELEEIILTYPEVEAIRLEDYEKLTQKEAAIKMNISQSTFCRLITNAREKIAEALITGKAIRIEGGNFKLE